MNIHKQYNVRELYRHYMNTKFREELQGEWAAALFYRGPAILLCPLFLKYSVRANTVTVISIVIVLVMPFSILLPVFHAGLCLGLLGIIFNILDCVDGNIARITESSSRTGRYADFIADVLHRVVLYMTLGVLVQSGVQVTVMTDLYPVLFMASASLLAVVARLSREYSLAWFPDGNKQAGNGGTLSEKSVPITLAGKFEKYIFSFISGLDTLTPVLVLVSAIAGNINWLVYWLLCYSLLDFLYTQFAVIRKIQ